MKNEEEKNEEWRRECNHNVSEGSNPGGARLLLCVQNQTPQKTKTEQKNHVFNGLIS